MNVLFSAFIVKVVGDSSAEIALQLVCIKLLHCAKNSVASYFQVTAFIRIRAPGIKTNYSQKLFTINGNGVV